MPLQRYNLICGFTKGFSRRTLPLHVAAQMLKSEVSMMSQLGKSRKYFSDYPDVVSVGEVCTMLRLGRNSVYSLLQSGKLQSVRIGSRYIIPAKWVADFLDDNKG